MAIIFSVSLIPLPFTVLTIHSSLNGEAPLYPLADPCRKAPSGQFSQHLFTISPLLKIQNGEIAPPPFAFTCP